LDGSNSALAHGSSKTHHQEGQARHPARTHSLRQAADTRLKRQAAAEEKAAKAPIKILFPTIFLVILGPAMLSLKQVLGF